MGIMKAKKKNHVKHLEKPTSLLCLVSLPSTRLKKALLKKALRNKVIRKVTLSLKFHALSPISLIYAEK